MQAVPPPNEHVVPTPNCPAGVGQFSTRSPSGTRVDWAQFSLQSIFVVFTVLAIYLGLSLGVTRYVLGASSIQGPLVVNGLFHLPLLVVWSVGLSMAVSRYTSQPRFAKLAAIMFGGMIANLWLGGVLRQIVVMGIGPSMFGWANLAISLVTGIVNLALWLVLLVLVFRQPDSM